MRRVEEIFDVWFDSGSMPFAQMHYTFENSEQFESHNPADFIVEYIGQTRGWFYVMHVLSTALFDRPAFTSVICHGIVLGEDGQKMSKSLGNYPDVREMFDKYGADAMRWFLMSSPILRGGNLVVDEPKIRDAFQSGAGVGWLGAGSSFEPPPPSKQAVSPPPAQDRSLSVTTPKPASCPRSAQVSRKESSSSTFSPAAT